MFRIGCVLFSIYESFGLFRYTKGKQCWFQVIQLVNSWLTWISIVCKNLNIPFGAERVNCIITLHLNLNFWTPTLVLLTKTHSKCKRTFPSNCFEKNTHLFVFYLISAGVLLQVQLKYTFKVFFCACNFSLLFVFIIYLMVL